MSARKFAAASGLICLPATIAITSVTISAEGVNKPLRPGETLYQNQCAVCHGTGLGGTSFAPALTGEDFGAKWASHPDDLTEFVKKTMPPANPGGLPSQSYDDIVAHIKEKNGFLRPTAKSSDQPSIRKPGAPLFTVVANNDDVYKDAVAARTDLLQALAPVSEEMLRQPPPGDWLSYRRTDDSQGFSPLRQINNSNAGALTLAWSAALKPGTNGITPLVHDGILFVNSNGTVTAFDARSGDALWSFSRDATVVPYGSPITQPRGIGLFEELVIVPTLDNHVIALDARSGKIIWDRLIPGLQDGLRITSAPLIVKGKILQGMSGCAGSSEPGGCFIVALDARSGKELWRFHTIARPDPSEDSWNNAPLGQRFGGSLWAPPSYDAKTGLVYFGPGQTYRISTLMLPDGARNDKNAGLYTDTTLALDSDTGKLIWHYQHFAREVWDLDWAFERTITDIVYRNSLRRVVMTIGKLGIMDVLDARTGQYLFSHDLGLQSLVTSIDSKTGWKHTGPAVEPEVGRWINICPDARGVRNWPATSYDEAKQILYVPVARACMNFKWLKGQEWEMTTAILPGDNVNGKFGGMIALDIANRRVTWSRYQRSIEASAVLATAGGLIFEGDRARHFRASDSASGKILWDWRLDNVPSASPISFMADGVQYVAVTTGGGNPSDARAAALTPEVEPAKPGTTLWVFKLGKP
jgi:alcohol dehydrogenase (cytochrome c)